MTKEKEGSVARNSRELYLPQARNQARIARARISDQRQYLRVSPRKFLPIYQVRKFTLGVALPLAQDPVVLCCLEVFKGDATTRREDQGKARDRNDTSLSMLPGRPLEQWKQFSNQEGVGNVVDPEVELVPVGCLCVKYLQSAPRHIHVVILKLERIWWDHKCRTVTKRCLWTRALPTAVVHT